MSKLNYLVRKRRLGDHHPHIQKKGMACARHAELHKLVIKDVKKGADVGECVLAIRALGEVIEKSSTPLILKKVRGIKGRGMYGIRSAKLGKKHFAATEHKRMLKGCL